MTAVRATAGVFAVLACLSTGQASAQTELLDDPLLTAGLDGGYFWATDGVELSGEPGAVCAAVPGGTRNPWDAIIGIDGFQLDKDQTYGITLKVSADPGGTMRAYAQMAAEPWTPEGEIVRSLGSGETSASIFFTADASHAKAQLAIQLGGSPEPWRFCLHHVSIMAGVEPPSGAGQGSAGKSAAGSALIRLNQDGYFPDGPKRANFISAADKPLAWQLLGADGGTVLAGTTRPKGRNMSSGLDVHVIDFSKYQGAGEGFLLKVEGETSYPFAIGETIYDPLRVDAFSYFYPVRSGVEISDATAGEGYGRPAGHLGEPPNGGDTSVGCVDRRTAIKVYGEAWGCDYRLDVRGGWYDAGDFGKYVVNGGIAVAQMMGAYERALHYARNSPALGDELLRIPESGNGVPDLLDEARWELDFLVSMMVPEGKPLAGMAHHKVHGNRWTLGPILPHLDPEPRVLHRPSTAATLNLAAATAQGARLFAPFDAEYAGHLLTTATRAYHAAEAHPDLHAPLTDGSFGGGDYSDDDASDEFYWAAAELYLTTGKAEWLDRLKASPYWNGRVFSQEGISWRSVAGLGRINLATIPSGLPDADLKSIQNSVRAAADVYLATQSGEAFGFMYRPKDGFGWGSNQSLIQNMIVTAAAYDISGKRSYLNGVRESMDYILGRNAMGISYVTGHGSRFAHRQFSNMFAQATDPSYPPLPTGALAGGPNSQPADDLAIRKLKDCAPQTCYLDDPRSYSTNEIAINWNAPLGWIASFLADAR